MIVPGDVQESELANKRSANVALLGVLSKHLGFAEGLWVEALKANLPPALHEANLQAFQVGRRTT
jgi:Pyruvate/2-oxoacid:ferredoxin oxidoreductase gamma subunit